MLCLHYALPICWRHLGGSDWRAIGAESQPTLGVLTDIELGHSPLYATVSGQVSASDIDDDIVDDGVAAVFDLAVGLKLMARQGMFRPYAAAGLTSTGVAVSYDDEDGDERDDSDQTFGRSEEHPSELRSLMRISYAVICLK